MKKFLSVLVMLLAITLILGVNECALAQFTLDSRTLGLWHFNETGGSVAYDETSNNYDLTLANGATWSPNGVYEGCLDLTAEGSGTGPDNYAIGSGTDSLTIEAWVRIEPEAYNSYNMIVTRYNNYTTAVYYLFIGSEGGHYGCISSCVYTTGGYAYANTPDNIWPTDGDWHLLRLTWSSGQPARVFLDDILQATGNVVTGTVRTSSGSVAPFRVGTNPTMGYPETDLDGWIDELRISDVVRTGEFEADPRTLGLWHFNETSGSVAYDETPNNYDLTLANGATWSPSGVYGGCLDLTAEGSGTGPDNYAIGSGTDSLTIEAWVRIEPEAYNSYNMIVTRYNNYTTAAYYLFIGADGGHYGCISSCIYTTGGYAYANTLDNIWPIDGNWHRICLTWSSGQPARVYIDNKLKATGNIVTGTVRTSSGSVAPFRVGTNPTMGYPETDLDGWIDELRISDIVRIPPPPPSALDINNAPINPPIVISANGGFFQYNMNIHNLTTFPQTFAVWNKVRQPSGAYALVFGPITRTLPGNANPARSLTQTIASSIEAGLNNFISYIGTYPNVIVDSSFFTFTKSAITDGGQWVSESRCEGDFFEEYAGKSVSQDACATITAKPNPFNPSTNITYNLPAAARVNLSIFDIGGRLLATLVDGYRDAGVQEVNFDASGLPSGVYLAKLQSGNRSQVQKMVLLK